jgi:hypothetical protein
LLSPPRWSQPSCCQEALQSFGCPPECAAGDPKRRLTQCAEVISFEDVWLYCIEILHRNSQDLVGLELITYIILYPSFIPFQSFDVSIFKHIYSISLLSSLNPCLFVTEDEVYCPYLPLSW